MGLFDVHAHLTQDALAKDTGQIVSRAEAAGLSTVVVNGLNPSDNLAVLAMSKAFGIVKPAVGFYPVDAVLSDMLADGLDYPRESPACSAEEGIASVTELAKEAIAIGEIGLDGYWVPEKYWDKQDEVFKALVKVAMDFDLPIIIHTRKREKRTFEILKELGATRVNWHCFGGKVALARQIAEHGHYLSIPSNARRSESFTRMIETVPRDRLLLETDCPYLGPVPGEHSEPKDVRVTFEYMMEKWSEPEPSVQATLEANFERLFRQKP